MPPSKFKIIIVIYPAPPRGWAYPCPQQAGAGFLLRLQAKVRQFAGLFPAGIHKKPRSFRQDNRIKQDKIKKSC